MPKRKRTNNGSQAAESTKIPRRSSSVIKTEIKIDKNETYMQKGFKSPILAKYEDLASRVYRLVLNERASEAKAIEDKASCQIKLIEDYKPVTDLKITDLFGRKGLASVLVLSYVLCEDDLHKGNWGINTNNEVVKIDHDMSLWPFIQKDRGLRRFQGNPKDNFKITRRDIENFPLLADADPWYWITEHRVLAKPSHSYSLSDTATFARLKDDPAFKAEKYKYFLKSILFINNEKIKEIAAEVFPEDANRRNGVVNFLSARIEELRRVLIEIPEFRKHVLDHLEWGQEFADEFTDGDQKKNLEDSYSRLVLDCAVKHADYLYDEIKDITSNIKQETEKLVADNHADNIRIHLVRHHSTISYSFKKDVSENTLQEIEEEKEKCLDEINGSLDVLDKIFTKQEETRTLWDNKRDSIIFGIKSILTCGLFLVSRLRKNWKQERELGFFEKPQNRVKNIKSVLPESSAAHSTPKIKPAP